MQISTKTAVDWYNFLCDVCAQYFVDHPVKIGGPGIELEIDESKFGRHKYNRGRYVDEHCVYILEETGRLTEESFLVEVQQIRDAQTLLSIIR